MSIATRRGDSGQTSLAGGVRVSKSDMRVETYGTVDELNTVLGFARSICQDGQIRQWTEEIQRTLFRLGSNLATPPESKNQPPKIGSEDIEHLTKLVHRIETTEGLVSDWSLPGAYPEAAAYEMARTTCRRAERAVVRFIESGGASRPQRSGVPESLVRSDLAIRATSSRSKPAWTPVSAVRSIPGLGGREHGDGTIFQRRDGQGCTAPSASGATSALDLLPMHYRRSS